MSVSVTNIAAMQAVQTTFFQASSTTVQTVFVESVGDFFRFQRGGTAAVVANQVVASLDGQGQWHRMKIPNRRWQSQLAWSIDESNATGKASDENTGADDTHPLLTIDEFISRVQEFSGTDTFVVRWLSNTTHAGINLASMTPRNMPAALSTSYPLVIFVGVPTVLRTGTLTGASDAPWTVADSTLPVSWASSGLVSTSAGTRMIRKTDKTKHAFIAYENSAKTAQTSPTNGFTEALAWLSYGTPSASFTNGDAYEVVSLPTFPRVTPPDCSAGYGAALFILLDMDGILGGQVHVRHCGFRGFADLNAATRSGVHQIYGCMFVSGCALSSPFASSALDRTLMIGSVAMGTYSGDMNNCVNVVAKTGNIIVSHHSWPRLGTIYVFDDTATTVILITNNATVTLDALHGSGNTGTLLSLRDSGCSVNSTTTTPLTAFDAATSAAKPISVVGTTYNYVDIPIVVANKGAYFVTN